jgi:hypothetical protein
MTPDAPRALVVRVRHRLDIEAIAGILEWRGRHGMPAPRSIYEALHALRWTLAGSGRQAIVRPPHVDYVALARDLFPYLEHPGLDVQDAVLEAQERADNWQPPTPEDP